MIEYGLNLDTYNNYRTQSKFASKKAIWVGGYVMRWVVRITCHPHRLPHHILTNKADNKKSSIRSYFDAALLYSIFLVDQEKLALFFGTYLQMQLL